MEDTGQGRSQEPVLVWTTVLPIGEVAFAGFRFEKVADLISGQWTIEVNAGRHGHVSQGFTVVQAGLPSAGDLPPVLRPLLEAMRSGECERQESAVVLAGLYGPQAAPLAPVILDVLRRVEVTTGCRMKYSGRVTDAARLALVDFGEPAVPALIESLGSPQRLLQSTASQVLGEMGMTVCHSVQEAAVASLDPEIRQAAVALLGHIGCACAKPTLLNRLEHDRNFAVQATAVTALGSLGGAEVVAALCGVIQDRKSELGFYALEALENIGDATVVPTLEAVFLANDDRNALRAEALRVAVALGGANVVSRNLQTLLRAAQSDPDRHVRLQSVTALANPSNRLAGAGTLLAALHDEHWAVREAAARGLGHLGVLRAEEELIAGLDDHIMVFYAAAASLGRIRSTRAVPHLIALLNRPGNESASIAAYTLGRIGTPTAVAALGAAVDHPKSDVRTSAVQGLGWSGRLESIPLLIDVLCNRRGHGESSTASEALLVFGRDAVEPLIESFRDDDVPTEAVARTLARIGRPAVTPLIEALSDGAESVRQGATEALGKLRAAEAAPALIAVACTDLRTDYFPQASRALGMIGKPAVEGLVSRLDDPSPVCRRRLVDALALARDTSAVWPMVTLLQHEPDPAVRQSLIRALGSVGESCAVPQLLECLANPETEAGAIGALGAIGDPAAVEALIQKLGEVPARRTNDLIGALGAIGDSRAVGVIVSYLDSPEKGAVEAAAEALGEIADVRATKPLVEALTAAVNSGQENRAWKITTALRKISGLPLCPDPWGWGLWLKLLEEGVVEMQKREAL